MATADPTECSAISLASAEPLLGTASRVRRWLFLEQPGTWGHNALLESDLPRAVGIRLRDLSRDLGIRVVLIKRRRPSSASRSCYLAYAGAHERRLRRLTLADPAEVLDLDLAGLAPRRFAEIGEDVTGPLFLVCTHGKHDRCCARYGGATARALADHDDAWECTHIGGDRFAANLLAFPHGLYFGRVTPADAERVVGDYRAGRIALDRYRGRAAFSPPVQAAEAELRTVHGLDGVDDLELVDHVQGAVHRVTFRDPAGGSLVAEVNVGRFDPRSLTCKATHAHAPRAFVVRELEGVED